MSIRRLDSGRYQARYRDPAGRERSGTFRRRGDAERHLREVRVAMDRGEWSDPRAGRVTLEEWVDTAWELGGQVSPRTDKDRRARISRHVLPHFGADPINRIDREVVQKWVNGLSAAGYEASTVKKIFLTLSSVLRTAVRYDRLVRSPCDWIELPAISRHPMRFLIPDEVSRLAEAITPHYELMIRFAAESGLRIGEIGGLQGGDYQPATRTLSVKRQLLKDTSPPIYSDPKTRAGIRSLTLSPRLGARIEELQVFGDDPLFTSTNGRLLNVSNFRRRHFTPAVDNAGLHPLRIHDLRHTAISYWIHKEANVKLVTERAGIASVRTAFDTYGHLYPNADRELANRL